MDRFSEFKTTGTSGDPRGFRNKNGGAQVPRPSCIPDRATTNWGCPNKVGKGKKKKKTADHLRGGGRGRSSRKPQMAGIREAYHCPGGSADGEDRDALYSGQRCNTSPDRWPIGNGATGTRRAREVDARGRVLLNTYSSSAAGSHGVAIGGACCPGELYERTPTPGRVLQTFFFFFFFLS